MNDEVKKWASIIFALLSMVWLALILSGGANRELVWFIVPLGGLYRMIGGTWNKAIGRFLAPALPVVAVLLLVGWSWWLPLIYGTYLLVKTLPFTLIGSSVHDNWFNWVWIWLLGLINGLACVTVGLSSGLLIASLFLSLVPCVAYGVCGTLSNVKSTARFFPWKLCEFVFGASTMIPPSMLIGGTL